MSDQWNRDQWNQSQQQGYVPEAPAPDARESRIKELYGKVEQPGLDPANRPGNTEKDIRDGHKTTRDLEDITGNPGHRNANPNAPAETMIEAGPTADAVPEEPQQLPPPEQQQGVPVFVPGRGWVYPGT